MLNWKAINFITISDAPAVVQGIVSPAQAAAAVSHVTSRIVASTHDRMTTRRQAGTTVLMAISDQGIWHNHAIPSTDLHRRQPGKQTHRIVNREEGEAPLVGTLQKMLTQYTSSAAPAKASEWRVSS